MELLNNLENMKNQQILNLSKKTEIKQNHNYQRDLDKILAGLTSISKPTLLLHACCGPCSSYVLEYLVKHFQITVFYYNPNIYPQEEYIRRLTELQELYKKFPPALEGNVQVIEKTYNPDDFYKAIDIKNHPELADEPEKGERCRRCYAFRLQAAFEFAMQNNFDYFCTTLSISPFKDAQKLNKIGENLQKNAENSQILQKNSQNLPNFTEFQKITKIPKWLPSDFKKKGGFKRSLELSKEYSLYRQEYCGCVYSKNSQ